ncbi:MAG: glycerol-3-phosphate dehydrogenase/oxidase [Desulfobacter sp.]|nr:glycerol-3-phosphate dehydrogenase/oxidase [Desulfobacter sp.]
MRMNDIDSAYDLVIVGGGVTGAGVFHQAVHLGLKLLLVESQDFAWGTSSRSSKMVHGGLRYLKEGTFLLTRSAVKERQRMLSAYPGLVTPLDFIMPIYKNYGPSKTTIKTGLSIYSLMAGQRQHCFFNRETTLEMVRGICPDALASSVGFMDAQVDDARLVLRLIFDACDMGGHALNYTAAVKIDRDRQGRVRAVQIKEADTGNQRQIATSVVINATGAFVEKLHPSPVKGFHIRPLRGSHLIFPGDSLDLDRVISFIHPRDRRPVFLFPWEGCLVLGTTDMDFKGNLEQDPSISNQEIDYLMEGLGFIFPHLDLGVDNALSSICGVRPVLSKKKKQASKESREHVVWKDKGLVTVTGGKLTTFSLLAKDALRAAGAWLPKPEKGKKPQDHLKWHSGRLGLSPGQLLRLQGRYGARAEAMTDLFNSRASECVGSSHTLWAELIHGARAEQVRHLSDLLLRRVRIGLVLPNGGMDIMDRIQKQVSPFLDWDPDQWKTEILNYKQLWDRAYSPRPGQG